MDNKRKALIVDDLDSIIVQIELLLKRNNIDTVSKKNINEALSSFKENIFDFIIMDLCMPTKKDGLDLLTELKKHIISSKLNTKVIVMSGSCAENVINECIENGADNYIEKDENWSKNLLETIK